MRKNSKLLSIYLGGIIILLLLIFGPFVLWDCMEDIPLNIWIVDKTVAKTDYREHKGIMWVLNHNKVINKKTGEELKYDRDYYGFFPVDEKDYNVKDIPDTIEYPDLIYLADTYGVYTEDLLELNPEEMGVELIYGGLDGEELKKITRNIGYGNTIIGEFNIAASPTDPVNRKRLEPIFGIQWSGWRGRYFKELEGSIEIPKMFIENYEKQEDKEWNFKGPGYILLSENGEIVVLEDRKHIGEKGLTIKFEEDYISEFKIEKSVPYYYWFEFIESDKNNEDIANYHLDLTKEGKKIFEDIGLSSTFIAVTRKSDLEYKSYYFSGDFADLDNVNKNWNYYGMQNIEKATSILDKKAPDYFYWNAYVPMMRKIISDLDQVKEDRESNMEHFILNEN